MSYSKLPKRNVIALTIPIEQPPMDHVGLEYLVLVTHLRVGVLLYLPDGAECGILLRLLVTQHVMIVPMNDALLIGKYPISVNAIISRPQVPSIDCRRRHASISIM